MVRLVEVGTRLYLAATTSTLPIGNPARLVLARMAMMALDDDPLPLYFGGRDRLIRCLGRGGSVAKVGSSTWQRERNADVRAVDRAISELVEHGAIDRINPHPRQGERAEYALRPPLWKSLEPFVGSTPQRQRRSDADRGP